MTAGARSVGLLVEETDCVSLREKYDFVGDGNRGEFVGFKGSGSPGRPPL